MFSSERGRRFGLSGDIFRKLYPRPLLHREFSGQSRMIPQILRFRSSAREFQLRRTDLTAAPPLDGRIRLRESSCLRETFDYVNADFKQRISTLNGKYMKKLFFADDCISRSLCGSQFLGSLKIKIDIYVIVFATCVVTN